jgi:hypothetical protein
LRIDFFDGDSIAPFVALIVAFSLAAMATS